MPSASSVSGAHLRRLPILGLAQCSFDRIHTVPVVHLGAASFFFHAAAYLHRYAAALAVPRCSPTRTRRTTTLRHRCSASARQGLAPARFQIRGRPTRGFGLRRAPITAAAAPLDADARGVLGPVIARQQRQHHVVDVATLDRVVCRLRCRLPHGQHRWYSFCLSPPSLFIWSFIYHFQ
jgi:hypothetical protein